MSRRQHAEVYLSDEEYEVLQDMVADGVVKTPSAAIRQLAFDRSAPDRQLAMAYLNEICEIRKDISSMIWQSMNDQYLNEAAIFELERKVAILEKKSAKFIKELRRGV